jgi:DNA-directed RNA polymerase specialized sigma24 family protein
MKKAPFEAVVADHGPTVLRVCLAVLGPIDADDAWSETFLSAMKAYPELPGDASVEAWLVTIAHRKAIDVTRGRPVGQLPPKQRQAVAYRYLAGLPYTDVAAIVGGTTDAARRASADGIAALRRTCPRFAEASTTTSGDAR